MVEQIVNDRLKLISENCQLIIDRISNIHTASAFLESNENIILLDAIAMRLQVIGEHVKKVEHIYPNYFHQIIGIDPNPCHSF